MQLEIDVMLDYQFAEAADVLLQIEVAQMADQRLIGDKLTVSSPEKLRPVAGEESIGQRTWAVGQGTFHAVYSALVDIDRPLIALDGLEAADPRDLPSLVLPYIMPSRYVEADRFEPFVESRFGDAMGGQKIMAMLDWMNREMAYVPGSSDSETSAMATFVQRQGVCRDYAHLLIALARAARIPARMVSAYAPDVTPQDFHAVVEIWLADGWHLVDPTNMALPGEIARIATGRDATDIAFMTIFGTAEMMAQSVNVKRTA
ncbi:transglutaminase-like domain-containing protein [Sphingobium boeckii]|uniref:Transglutaminase-like putative cysteine protease n=1 Tax=Sphingobium boeckii TaxID=1082345 RepID=A0A7W9AE81_9SPHN|nr:transglutaminase family protein [Sphingobium boeckii]MBB5684038.1 transglutaminase-like putative cysteine protease [Sphingobium boeckii]